MPVPRMGSRGERRRLPVRVGIYPVVDRESGGSYQYSASILDAMGRLRDEFDPVIVHDRAREVVANGDLTQLPMLPSGPTTPRSITRRALVQTMGEPTADRIAKAVRGSGALRSPSLAGALGYSPSRIAAWLRQHGIDLMLYASPTGYAVECGLPFVMPVHDLQHRIHPEFPEVSAGGEFESRERLYRDALSEAEAILVDSEVGREDVLEYYGELITPDRVHVLPFVPSPHLAMPPADVVAQTIASLGIPERYLLFPAQLWPHKNHQRVLEAITQLRRDGVVVNVVLTGSSSGEIRSQVLKNILEIIDGGSIQGQVSILGYVDDATISSLYAGAHGVILPTFFGPTNIPVLEAWAHHVPVLTSDIRGIREQCGDAAILIDPMSVEAIADGLQRLWEDEAVRRTLIAAGNARSGAAMDPIRFAEALRDILRTVAGSLASRAHHVMAT
jgi:glycosyltransferase involved in cell wall biosynthesis